jgi:conjugative relaxase-like TrwC/TraI family protein
LWHVLSIGKLTLGQQRYYDQQVAHGHDDYYSGRGEAPGTWTGAGAGELGLSGGVSADQFNALLAGQDPRDPERPLRAGISQPQVAALDLTFSAPKSVSVLYAVAPAEVSAALVDCHEHAVAAALGYLEDTAVFVRRGRGGRHFEPAGGLIAAAYRHRMSRSLDPQLHTHVVAANLARGCDGRYTALHHPSLFRAAKTAGYLYQAHLRAEVRDRLELEWGPVSKGAAELCQLPAGVLQVFSRRSAEVREALAAQQAVLGRELSWAERKAFGTLATRDRKHYGIETHTWREEITARAAEHGLDHQLVDELLTQGRERAREGRLAGEGELECDGAPFAEGELGELLAGPCGLTERQSTFEHAEALREFAQAAAQGARVETIRGQVERFVERPDVLSTRRGTLTTGDLVGCERSLIAAAVRRAGDGSAQLDHDAIESALSTGGRALTAEQAAAVRAVVTSGNGVDVIQALAGTGKTFTAGALREAYEQAGVEVLGVAPSARAARELQEQAGIPARTLDSRLLAIENGWQLPRASVLVLDEAAMAPTRLTARLLEHAAARGTKVIAIGDSGQLPSVLAGGWLTAVADRLGAVRLTEVMRQRDPAERRVLAALHDGIPTHWLAWAQASDRVQLIPEGQDAIAQVVSDWSAALQEHGPAQAVMIARENETRRALNELARAHRREAGMLGAERTYGPVTLAVGDRVICRQNDHELDVDNGLRGTVQHVARDGIVIETDAKLLHELPAGYIAEHVEHAYCLTGHGMQGATVEHATVLAHPHELSRGWSYTALSRARGTTRLLIAVEPAEHEERQEIAPPARRLPVAREELLARVARRMLERDDEDLAIDQLAPASPAPHFERAASPAEPLQERAAERAEPEVTSSRAAFARVGDQLKRLRSQLEALPICEMSEIDRLDARARDLSDRRERLHRELEQLPKPARRLLGRSHDEHLPQRTRFTSALAGADEELRRALAERASLAQHVGEPDRARQERDELERAIGQLQQERSQLRDELTDREIAARPDWLHQTLGERPDRAGDAERWDRAALALARYRTEYDIGDDVSPLGDEPSNRDQLRDYERARQHLPHARDRDTAIELEIS